MYLASKFILLLVACLVCVAFFTLLERKVLGVVGARLGPYKVSLLGVLQPLGDAGKLLNKEMNILSNFSFFFYYFTCTCMILSSLVLFSVMCEGPSAVDLKLGLLLLLIVLGLNSLNSILSGWSIFSKFSLIGSLRTVSQLVSYEVLLYVCLFFFLFAYFCFDLCRVGCYSVYLFFFLAPFLLSIWFLSVLAELNRTPYDFSEGESELVSGFNIEFGSCCFTLIFLAEYGNIFFFMYLSAFLFFFDFSLLSTCSFFFFLSLWVRSVLPRYRFDKLMSLSWKVLLPQCIFFFLLFFLLGL